jgi:hypothetical protein
MKGLYSWVYKIEVTFVEVPTQIHNHISIYYSQLELRTWDYISLHTFTYIIGSLVHLVIYSNNHFSSYHLISWTQNLAHSVHAYITLSWRYSITPPPLFKFPFLFSIKKNSSSLYIFHQNKKFPLCLHRDPIYDYRV